MSSTVLSISQDVAAVIGVAPITSLVGSSEPHARAMRVLANTAGRELQQMRNEDGQGWIVLTREHEFDTVVGQDAYAFPEDFDQIVDGTVWDRDSYRIARGPLSPQQWQNVKSGLIETTRISPNYRIRSTAQGVRQFWVDPTPGEIETLVIEYVSTHWVMSAQGERREAIQHDSDTTLFHEELIYKSLLWRFKESRGLSFSPQLAEYELDASRRLARDAGTKTITIGGRRGHGLFRRDQIPEQIPVG